MKKFLAIVLALAMVFALCACGSSASNSANTTPKPATEETPTDDGKIYEFTVAARAAEGDLTVASVAWFADEIENRTNGRIKLDIQYNGVLCSQGTEFEALESGICDIAVASLSSNATRWPSLGWVIVPGMVSNYLQQAACLNAVLDAGYVDADMEANNVKVLWWQGAECFNYALTNKRVETVSDLAGLKIGYAGGEYIANTLNATGATATGINPADFYMSLSTGVIDGFVNPARYMYDAQFYEVVKYMPVGITCGASNNSVYMNSDAFNSLPADLQATFLEVCAEAGEHFLDNAGGLYSDEYELLTASGCECYELSEEVVNEYLKICAGLSDSWVDAQVAAGNADAAAIRDLVLETAASVG